MKTAPVPALGFGALLAGISLGFAGCAATHTALEHRDLSVQTQMSSTVFLDLEQRVQKTVFLDVKNTSAFDLALAPLIKTRLEEAGYQIVSDPQAAFYILQVNVLHVGKANPSALTESVRSGWGGPVAGGLTGAAIASSTNTSHGNLKGAAIGLAAEMVAGSLVKNVTYSIITDIQITERTPTPVTEKTESKLHQGNSTDAVQSGASVVNWRKYRTRVVASANQVNLKFEEALPALRQQLARSIAGIM